jgi:hypothetical protein
LNVVENVARPGNEKWKCYRERINEVRWPRVEWIDKNVRRRVKDVER